VALALVPKVQDTSVPFTAFTAKYTTPGALGVGLDIGAWTGADYGSEAVYLIRTNLTADQRAALQSQPDAMVLPINLDNQVSGLALTTIQAKLEAVNLPAHWITTDMTYRQVVRGFRRVITFMQRWQGLHGETDRLFGGVVTLDTRLNQLTAQQRQKLSAVADSFGIDRSTVTNTMTIRQVLRLLADQLPDDPTFDGA
jgi:hypothetical protein